MKKPVKPRSKATEPAPAKVKDLFAERENWDFEQPPEDPPKDKSAVYIGCPANELYDCYEYEYSRELALSRQGEKPKVHPPVDKHDKRLNRFYELFAAEFPHTPWLKIDGVVRRERLNKLDESWPPMPAFAPVPLDALKKKGELHDELEWIEIGRENEMVTILPVRIAWQHSVNAIVDAFRSWLEQNKPTLPIPLINHRGNDNIDAIRIALKALGSYRLLQSRTATEAQNYSNDTRKSGHNPLYSSAKSWSKNKALAREIISSWDQPAKAALNSYYARTLVRGITEANLLSTVMLSGLRRLLAQPIYRSSVISLARIYPERSYTMRYFMPLNIPLNGLKSVDDLIPYRLTQGMAKILPLIRKCGPLEEQQLPEALPEFSSKLRTRLIRDLDESLYNDDAMAAIATLAKMNPQQIQQVEYELALALQQGLDLKGPTTEHKLKSLPGEFSGMKVVSYLYAAIQQFKPGENVRADRFRENAANLLRENAAIMGG